MFLSRNDRMCEILIACSKVEVRLTRLRVSGFQGGLTLL